jgi:two-component system, OmpR family, sensor histidine kinase TctE
MRNVAITIRRRLLFIFLAPLTLVIASGIVVDYVTSVIPVTTAYDQTLADGATAIAAHVSTDTNGGFKADLPPQAEQILRTDRFDAIYYLVLGPHAEFIAGDAGLPSAPSGAENPNYADATFHDRAVRISTYRMSTSNGIVSVSLAETTNKREIATRAILGGTVLTDCLQLAAILILCWFGVGYGLRPLSWLRDQITNRSARDLGPIDQRGVPGEVLPLTAALNGLFDTVQTSTQAQQQFLANAAHQLRTPLAGVQAKIELLIQSPHSAALKADLEDINEGCRRLAHTANQLLALARAEPSSVSGDDFRSVDLQMLVENVVEEFFDRAEGKGIDLGAETAAVSLQGSSWLLRESISNLVDNAIAYTPRGGTVTVACGISNERTYIEVSDDGPGIPSDERRRVLQRFYRVKDAAGHGCGLGLAIVDEISQLHGAHLSIDVPDAGHGTRVRITFPADARPRSRW